MASNYSILQRNILSSLESDEAKSAFLWACDVDRSTSKYLAEAYAREVDYLVSFLSPLIVSAGEKHGAMKEKMDDLRRYFLSKHRNMRFARAA